MNLSKLVHVDHMKAKEISGKHYMHFWDNESMICLEDEMVYDPRSDEYYLPKYAWRGGALYRVGLGMISI